MQNLVDSTDGAALEGLHMHQEKLVDILFNHLRESFISYIADCGGAAANMAYDGLRT
jgi:hypothetical protein